MSKKIIGIIDYGAGNCASVRASLTQLDYRTRLITGAADFNEIDLIVLPGVGAYSSAMESLNRLGLVDRIREWAYEGKPIVGICLGMQLLAEASYEHKYTRGLELIPGEVIQLDNPRWHIGWNTIEATTDQCHSISSSIGLHFYFNHSFEFKAPKEYVVGVSRLLRPVVAIVRRNNIFGIQFHPEKSQDAGREILRSVLGELLDA